MGGRASGLAGRQAGMPDRRQLGRKVGRQAGRQAGGQGGKLACR